VPTAKYTPCLNELRLGWDSVDWFAEDGRAGIEIFRTFDPFLVATVTESCDVSGAVPVESGYPDIERYEAVEFEPVDIEITIVPSGERQLLISRLLARRLAEEEIDGRPVVFTVDEEENLAVSPRVDAALEADQYVWIIEALDAEEGTVELRSNDPAVATRGIVPEDALDLIEEELPELFYRGRWYFTFEGGCITYEFDAKGTLAETVAADAEDALGFYPAFELRKLARVAGVPLTEYAEALGAYAVQLAGQLDALDTQIAETPTIETVRVALAQAVQVRVEFQEDLTALDPPDELAELHADLVDVHARIIDAQAAFATRAETAGDLDELDQSADALAYRAIDREALPICEEFRATIDASAANAVFADVPWVPGDIKEIVEFTFDC
jgi:hypothetical protein